MVKEEYCTDGKMSIPYYLSGMKNSILPFLLLFAFYNIGAQNERDTIRIQKNENSNSARFYFQDQKLKPKDLVRLTHNIPEAHQEAMLARKSYSAAQFLAFTGGFILGWQAVSLISQKDAPWAITILGIGALGVSIPYNQSYSKHAKNAAQLYNHDLNHSTGMERARLDIGISSSGVGLHFTY